VTEPILATKLYIPPARPDLVPRPRLIQRLNDGLRHPLTLVSAPAGFGKTTALSQWAHALAEHTPTPSIAWLSLDQADNDPLRFWQYFIAALQTRRAALGRMAQAALQAGEFIEDPRPIIESSLRALLHELTSAAAPLSLVLDDYHLIQTEAVHRSLNFLLDHLPPPLHLIIATRADPSLSLSRRRSHQDLVEVRTADLRFTPDEVATYLNAVRKLGLSDEDVISLTQRTEGWIVGLHLAALAMQSLPPSAAPRGASDKHEFVATFAGDDRYLGDYLVEEVLQRQAPHIQTFLRRTSILERLCDSLCDAVVGVEPSAAGPSTGTPAGASQDILEYLDRANLFVVPLDNQRNWYRYHHLFAELLRRHLQQSAAAEEISRLHLRASRWFECNGFIAEAVSHTLASSDMEYAANLVERYAGYTWDQGQTALVHNWLEALPEEAVRSRPFLCIRRAWFALMTHSESSKKAVERWIQDAERARAIRLNHVDELFADHFFGDVAAIRAHLFLEYDNHPEAVIESAQQALDRIPEHVSGPRAALFLAVGTAHWAIGDEQSALQAYANARKTGAAGKAFHAAFDAVAAQVHITCLHGQFEQAVAICREAVRSIAEPLEEQGQLLPAAAPIYIILGTILTEQGHREEAERALTQGIELAALMRAVDPYIQRMGYRSLIRLKRHQGDMASALDLADQVKRLGPQGDSWAAALRAQVWLAQAERDHRYLAAVARWAEEHQIELNCAGQGGLEQLTLARLLIAQHRLQRRPGLQPLLQFLDKQIQAAEEDRNIGRMLETLLLKAMALQAQGDANQALAVLEQTLILAEPAGFVLMFVDEGTPMARLLYQAAERGISPEYVGRLLAAFADSALVSSSPSNAPPDATHIEPLTIRERQLLQLLAEGLTNSEIAQRLIISLDTVKAHTRSIYGKLRVHNRTQAVARARTLGIL